MKNEIRKTDLLKNEKYSSYAQNEVFIKAENLQVGGSIKIRALYHKIVKLKNEGYEKIVVVSTGNTAKSVAYLCHDFALECEAVMPLTTSYTTIMEIEEKNAVVTLDGLNINETRENLSNKTFDDKTYIIDLATSIDSSLMYGTIVQEIINEKPETEIILVPVGTGSLVNGVLTYIKEHNLDIVVYAVEPFNHSTLTKSLEHGYPVKLKDTYTVAETINAKMISEEFFDNIKENVHGVIRVGDEELIDCYLDVVEENKMIVESSGLLPLAGSKYLREKNKNIVCILTGGNIDITTMSTMLQHGLTNKGRIFTFTTMLSDKPGELLEIAQTIAENKGNVIGLNHNQLSAITRQNKVELIVTVEGFGLPHKFQICSALENKGFDIKLIDDHLGSDFNE